MTHTGGRRPINGKAMTPAERQRAYAERHPERVRQSKLRSLAKLSEMRKQSEKQEPAHKPKRGRKPRQAATWPERRAAILSKRDPDTKRYGMS